MSNRDSPRRAECQKARKWVVKAWSGQWVGRWELGHIYKAFTTLCSADTLKREKFQAKCTAWDLAAVDAPGVIVCNRKTVASFYRRRLSYRCGLYCCSFSSIGQFSRPQSVDRTTSVHAFFMPWFVIRRGMAIKGYWVSSYSFLVSLLLSVSKTNN